MKRIYTQPLDGRVSELEEAVKECPYRVGDV